MGYTASGKVKGTNDIILGGGSKSYDFGNRLYCGGVKMKENIAIFSSEFGDEVDINNYCKCQIRKN